MKELTPNARILAIRLSAIGDVVRTLPAVALLRRRYPRAQIAWVVEEKAACVLEGDPVLDEIILFPRREFSRLAKNPLTWPKLWRRWRDFRGRLRSRQFDAVFDFHGGLKSGFIGWASGAPLRVGYERPFTKEGNWVFTNFKIRLSSPRINRYERNLALVRPWVPETEIAPTPLFIPLQDQAKISLFLARQKNGIHKRVVIHAGASQRHKRWPAERYAAVADALIERENAQVILTWGPREKEVADEVAAAMRHPPLLSPELTLKQLAELASHADLFISADSGPMHIAAAMGTPQIALFGPTDPQVNHPHNPKATLIRPKEPRHRHGFDEIGVEEVVAAALAKLKQSYN